MGEVFQLYKDELKRDELKAQLETLTYFPESTIDNVKEPVEFVQSLSASKKTLAPQFSLSLSEGSFSAVKRVKTYLCSTTSDCRLNHLMVLHVHKDRTDSLNMVEVANAFVEQNDSRHPIFSVFKKDGVPKQGTKRAATQTHFKH